MAGKSNFLMSDEELAQGAGLTPEQYKQRLAQGRGQQGAKQAIGFGEGQAPPVDEYGRVLPGCSSLGTVSMIGAPAAPGGIGVAAAGQPAGPPAFGSVGQAAGAQMPNIFGTGPMSTPFARELAPDSVLKNGGNPPPIRELNSVGGQFTPASLDAMKQQDEARQFKQDVKSQYPSLQDMLGNLQGPANYLVHGGEGSDKANNATYLSALDAYSRMQAQRNAAVGNTNYRDIENAKLGQAREFELGVGGQGGRLGIARGQLGVDTEKNAIERDKMQKEYIATQAVASRYNQTGELPPEGEGEQLRDRLGVPRPPTKIGVGGGQQPDSNKPAAPPRSVAGQVSDAILKAAPKGNQLTPMDQISSSIGNLSDEQLRNPEVFNELISSLRSKYGSQFDEGFSKQKVKPDWVARMGSGQSNSATQLRRLEAAYAHHGGGGRGEQPNLAANMLKGTAAGGTVGMYGGPLGAAMGGAIGAGTGAVKTLADAIFGR